MTEEEGDGGGGFGRLLLTSADGVKLLIKETAATRLYQPLPVPSSDPLYPPCASVATAFMFGTRAAHADTHRDPRLLRCHATYSQALYASAHTEKGREGEKKKTRKGQPFS